MIGDLSFWNVVKHVAFGCVYALLFLISVAVVMAAFS